MKVCSGRNETQVSEFILLGFPYLPGYQPALFVVFLVVYLIILSGNTTILIAVIMNQKLHKPMYFFLGNLAAVDMLFTTTTIPKMLALFLINSNTISFIACFTQLTVLHILGLFECFLLVVMAYDRYVAICNPLHYMSIMNNRFNILITISSFTVASTVIISLVVFTVQFPYCGPNKVNHCFCDHFFISKLACADISSIIISAACILVLCIFTPFLLVVLSYINILRTVLKMNSAAARQKSLSTCSSHLIVVVIYYLSIVVSYSSYRTGDVSDDIHALGSILFTVLAPALNPIIYALRNKDVKEAIKRCLNTKAILSK
ncbi:olfactory receptor 2AT4-like [Protopterus annectens]|uniref:olfactory receptor 2AT4-like n=1 Tax=Protopterus annectens TaxID=7888 RepID=UPI001CF9883C|nr:olfactory receptor 2AT4-like [Protopterus annectens]